VTISVSYRFDNTAVLITGAGSGIGAKLAQYCARGRCRDCRRSQADLLFDGLDAGARRLIDLQQIDVSDAAAVATMITAVRKKHPRLDAAVLGAAIQIRCEVGVMTAGQWREVIDVNLNGVFNCLNEIVPLMKAQKSGAIVAFTSGLATSGWPGASAYAASKAALVGMIKSLAHELKNHNVRANILSPGLRATPIFMDASTEAEREYYRASIGIGHADGVVPTLLYLISEASENLTGAVIEQRIILAHERAAR
jgi:NAD(P)-dependent dehydrogenase (short-subunit alcohol dehydrogenase family)